MLQLSCNVYHRSSTWTARCFLSIYFSHQKSILSNSIHKSQTFSKVLPLLNSWTRPLFFWSKLLTRLILILSRHGSLAVIWAASSYLEMFFTYICHRVPLGKPCSFLTLFNLHSLFCHCRQKSLQSPFSWCFCIHSQPLHWLWLITFKQCSAQKRSFEHRKTFSS